MKKILALTLALIMSLSCFSAVSFAADSQAVEHLTEVPDGYTGIYTKDDLDNIKLNMSGKYILMDNIIFDDSDFEKGGSFYNSGKGWEPIGANSPYFTGVFDGNNYYIKNLYINDSDSSVGNIGLFSRISGATVKNLNLKDVNITGYDTYYGTGGLSGRIYNSNVTNCSVSGKITGAASTGGICGESNGYSKIQYCSSSAEVSSPYNAGGIIGYQYPSSDARTSSNYIRYCYNSGTVISEKGCAGGISGESMSRYYWSSSSLSGTSYSYNTSYIIDSYNCGTIRGYSKAGGISAEITGDDTCSTYVKNCINVGNVSSDKDYGALIGYKEDSSVEACYYLDESVVSPTCTLGTSKSDDQLKKQSTFSGFDFETIWTMDGRDDYAYPELRDADLYFPGEDPDHKHEYTSEITTTATHLADGVMTFTCTCGDYYTETIEKIAEHTYEAVVTDPTCTSKGYTTYTCACGDYYIADYVDETDHTYKSQITTQPTHLTEGVETFTCECSHSYTKPVAKLEGHTYTSEITTKPTHTKEGVETFTCACGDFYTAAIDKLTEHNYKTVVTAPTCTSKGYTTYTCACGDSYVSDYVGTKTHNYTSTVTRPATHLSEGIKTYTCTACGDSYTVSIVKTKEHSYFVIDIVEPTCEKEGYTTYMCECGDTYNGDETPVTEHNYKGGKCTSCGESKTNNCTCGCHKTGFASIIWKILRFFYKIFKANPVCKCGVAHY